MKENRNSHPFPLRRGRLLHIAYGIVAPSVELQALREEIAKEDDSISANLRRVDILLEEGLIDEALHATCQAKLIARL